LSEQKHYLAPTAAAPLQAEVANRFGVLPNFFRHSPQSPEIRASLFCEVRYWISRHVAFGNGRAGGSADQPMVTDKPTVLFDPCYRRTAKGNQQLRQRRPDEALGCRAVD